jgi:hypothetical protein
MFVGHDVQNLMLWCYVCWTLRAEPNASCPAWSACLVKILCISTERRTTECTTQQWDLQRANYRSCKTRHGHWRDECDFTVHVQYVFVSGCQNQYCAIVGPHCIQHHVHAQISRQNCRQAAARINYRSNDLQSCTSVAVQRALPNQ